MTVDELIKLVTGRRPGEEPAEGALYKMESSLTRSLNQLIDRETWQIEFQIHADCSRDMIGPMQVRFYYAGARLKYIAVEGEGRRALGENVVICSYYDNGADVPDWIIDLVAEQMNEI